MQCLIKLVSVIFNLTAYTLCEGFVSYTLTALSSGCWRKLYGNYFITQWLNVEVLFFLETWSFSPLLTQLTERAQEEALLHPIHSAEKSAQEGFHATFTCTVSSNLPEAVQGRRWCPSYLDVEVEAPKNLRQFAKSYISRSGRTANRTQLVLVWFHVWRSLPSPQTIPTTIWSFGQRVETYMLIITVQNCVMQGTSLPVHKWFKDPSTSLGELHSACTLASTSSHLRWQSPTQLWRLRPPWARSGSFPWHLCHPASQTYSSPFFFSLKLKGKQAVSMQSVSSWI